eukprot:11270157-Heterocapsa_arctica.AAC.1
MCVGIVLLICVLTGAVAGAVAMKSWASTGRQRPPTPKKEKEKVDVLAEDFLDNYANGQGIGGPRRRGLAALQNRARHLGIHPPHTPEAILRGGD